MVRIDEAAYQRALGAELRALRRTRRWTRKELVGRLDTEISVQTLASYEQGVRHCSVVRFVELCQALGVLPHEVLDRVDLRAFACSPVGRTAVDLRRAAGVREPEYAPLRRWAAQRGGAGPNVVYLDATALTSLATLCGVPLAVLAARLAELDEGA
ncbi:helix-turn-helix domain-containing protein [Actinokineospora pegani]|uniref:helix-turn-helix domain-containing protein n=1 Tax=Actinokineospora pegani TaxID=2654637 RepID=UPI0012EA2C5A|nr:helix-turn-helix transcriptional regulator [Actinokineospora pegani]